ncbi:MAG: response regulator [Sphingomonas sp.]|jgi:CheY-like chemotaxis protein|nr:response regulator [Sphingomonas sp.]
MGQALGSDSTPLQLLLIEDDEEVRRSFQLLLQGHGYEVRAFAGARSAMAGDHSPFDVMICDYRLPDGDGLSVLRAMREGGWQGRAILMTGFPDARLRDEARACGFEAVLEKPLRARDLVAALG